MLLGICGGKCSGKATIAEYLVKHHGFRRLLLPDLTSTSNIKENHPMTMDPKEGTGSIEFASSDDLLAFVTKHWRSRFVTTHISYSHSSLLSQLSQRPFFLFLHVDAPVLTRYRRFMEDPGYKFSDLESFIKESDKEHYHPQVGLSSIASRAQITLLNTSSTVTKLHATLDRLALHDESRLRPSWDAYFMALASLASQRSNCMKRRVGCVLVRDRRVVATGYNGTPRGLTNCSHGGCPRCNSGEGSGVSLATCLCLHAEENALLEAGRGRISGGDAGSGGGEGAILYCNTCPCLTCSIKIAQTGIQEVVYAQGYSMDDLTARVLGEVGVRLRQFVPPAHGVIHLENFDLN